jgi:type VI protein secretion system component VasK
MRRAVLLLCLAALAYAAAYRFLWAAWPEWPRLDGLPVDRWFWSGGAMLGGLTACAATMSWSRSCPRWSPGSAGGRRGILRRV